MHVYVVQVICENAFIFIDSGFVSMVMAPEHPELTFTLDLVRSEPTFAQPEQEWQFVSDYAVRMRLNFLF